MTYQTGLRQALLGLAALMGVAVGSGQARAATACATHFWGGVEPALVNPKLASAARPLCFRSFAVLHSGVARTSIYAAEYLTRPSVIAAQALVTRDNRFHAEALLPRSERAELSDYTRSGYDRGHMAPSGNMGDADSDYESFSLANIVPQAERLNRTSWAELESYVRNLTVQLGDAYVVTGPMYEGNNLRALKRRVLVPTSVWKAVYVPGQGAGAWIATNKARSRWQVVSISTLIARSGVDPFPTLDLETKARVPAFPNFGARSQQPRKRLNR